MARERDPNRDKAFELYEESGGSLGYREIARELDILPKTVSAWKTRDRWDMQMKSKSTNKSVDSAKKSTKGSTNADNSKKAKKRGGNPNPSNGFAKHNQAATKNAIFSKYIPAESLEIMDSLEYKTPADILWDQITIQYTAIIRSQKIMEVKENETIKAINKIKSDAGIVVGADMAGEIVNEIGYELSFAFDRQANFINALSRGMSELRNLVKQFNVIADEDDERRLKIEVMQLKVVESELNIDIKDRTLAAMDEDSEDKDINITFFSK